MNVSWVSHRGGGSVSSPNWVCRPARTSRTLSTTPTAGSTIRFHGGLCGTAGCGRSVPPPRRSPTGCRVGSAPPRWRRRRAAASTGRPPGRAPRPARPPRAGRRRSAPAGSAAARRRRPTPHRREGPPPRPRAGRRAADTAPPRTDAATRWRPGRRGRVPGPARARSAAGPTPAAAGAPRRRVGDAASRGLVLLPGGGRQRRQVDGHGRLLGGRAERRGGIGQARQYPRSPEPKPWADMKAR